MAFPALYFPERICQVVGDERLKNSLFTYITKREIKNVSFSRRLQMKYSLNELFKIDYDEDDFHKQINIFWHLDKIIDCTNDKALFIIDFIEHWVIDSEFHSTDRHLYIFQLLSNLRTAFVERGDLEPLPRNMDVEKKADDMFQALLKWFDGAFDN